MTSHFSYTAGMGFADFNSDGSFPSSSIFSIPSTSSSSSTSAAAANPAAADLFPDVGFVSSVRELSRMPSAPGVTKTPIVRMKEYGAEIDKAVESGRPCIREDHTERVSDCQHCSAVDLFKVRKGHLGERNSKGKSTAHKVDLPRMDDTEEWFVMLETEKAFGKDSKVFDEQVDKAVADRKYATPQDKHWVLSHQSLSRNGTQIAWGKEAGEQSGESGQRKGKERQIKNNAGEKAYGLILYDTAAAIKLHQLHFQDGKHLGRDSLAKAFQAEGYKAPGKANIADWIKGCPGCKHRTSPTAQRQSKRGRQEAFGEEEIVEETVRPAPTKRSKATPKTKTAPPVAMMAPPSPQPQMWEPEVDGLNPQAVAQVPQVDALGPYQGQYELPWAPLEPNPVAEYEELDIPNVRKWDLGGAQQNFLEDVQWNSEGFPWSSESFQNGLKEAPNAWKPEDFLKDSLEAMKAMDAAQEYSYEAYILEEAIASLGRQVNERQ